MTNGDIIRGLYDDFATGNIPGVLGAMDANISWTEAEGFMYGGTYTGPNGVLENVFMKIGSEWERFAAVPENIVDGGDMVVALGTYSGKYLKTGKSVTVPFAHAWTFADGKIVKFVQYTDTLVVARDLGL
jgi:ketosteroid isomerase-like protein